MRCRTCKLKSLEKTGYEGKGKVSLHPLNNFSNLFFKKIAIFVTLEETTQSDFQSNLRKNKISQKFN